MKEQPFEDEIMRPPVIIPLDRAKQRHAKQFKTELPEDHEVKPKLTHASHSDVEVIDLADSDVEDSSDETSFCGTPAAGTEAETTDDDDEVRVYNYDPRMKINSKGKP